MVNTYSVLVIVRVKSWIFGLKVSTSVKVFFKVFLLSLNRVQKDRIGYPCQKFEQFEIFKMAAGGHLEFQLFSAKKLK